MTKDEAKRLGMKKWEWLGEHSNPEISASANTKKLVEVFPELAGFRDGCAYCEKYGLPLHDCSICPLCIADGHDCWDSESTFRKWVKAPTKANAKRVFNIIWKT